MKLRKWFVILPVALAFAITANAQQQPPLQKAPAKKAKKVWGDEDVASLRTDADKFVDKKTADEAAAKAAAEAAKGNKVPPPPPAELAKIAPGIVKGFPTTVEGMEKRVAEKKEEMAGTQALIPDLEKSVQDAPNDLAKAALQKKLDSFRAIIKEQETELKALEYSLQQLKSGAAPATPPAKQPQG
ncbi:MAG: hypothetical protein HY046_01450 [Acidobacteria bacterium]|nr:hypothetical protein [Acidobacteriota bacterium]